MFVSLQDLWLVIVSVLTLMSESLASLDQPKLESQLWKGTHILICSMLLVCLLALFVMSLVLFKTLCNNYVASCVNCGIPSHTVLHMLLQLCVMRLVKYSVVFLRHFVFLYHVCSCAVSNLKKCSLELGGKSPLIIFSDCDMDRAVRQVRMHCTIIIAYHCFYMASKDPMHVQYSPKIMHTQELLFASARRSSSCG